MRTHRQIFILKYKKILFLFLKIFAMTIQINCFDKSRRILMLFTGKVHNVFMSFYYH